MSADGHYSVFKVALLLKLQVVVVPSLANGEMDYELLKEKLLMNSSRSAIVVANIGSTMRQAVDNIDLIVDALREAGLTESHFMIHCDAALSGVTVSMLWFAVQLSFVHHVGACMSNVVGVASHETHC